MSEPVQLNPNLVGLAKSLPERPHDSVGYLVALLNDLGCVPDCPDTYVGDMRFLVEMATGREGGYDYLFGIQKVVERGYNHLSWLHLHLDLVSDPPTVTLSNKNVRRVWRSTFAGKNILDLQIAVGEALKVTD